MNTTWPFAEIFAPLADEALSGVCSHPIIAEEFSRHLQKRLAEVLSLCCYIDFSAHRMSFEICEGSRRRCYATFVERVKREGLTGVLDGFAGAGEALQSLVRQTRDFAEDFTRHFNAGRNAIGELVGPNESLELASVRAGLSDPHRGGRTVIAVTFQSGQRVFYKPRSLAVDAAWRKGLLAFNESLRLPLMAGRVHDAGDHGWAEAIAEQKEVSTTEVANFYWRFGALLCVAWLLDAIDIHRDNVIVAGEQPVLIDAECLLHPFAPGETRSLARTGIVPHPIGRYDSSCFGEMEYRPRRPKWENLGTDDLARVTIPAQEFRGEHYPRVGGRAASPWEYAENVEAGFATAATAANQNSHLIEQWRSALATTRRRVIRRHTSEYSMILIDATRPQHMISANIASRRRRELLAVSGQSESQDWEEQQLAQWDIPILEHSGQEKLEMELGSLAHASEILRTYLRQRPQSQDRLV